MAKPLIAPADKEATDEPKHPGALEPSASDSSIGNNSVPSSASPLVGKQGYKDK